MPVALHGASVAAAWAGGGYSGGEGTSFAGVGAFGSGVGVGGSTGVGAMFVCGDAMFVGGAAMLVCGDAVFVGGDAMFVGVFSGSGCGWITGRIWNCG